MALRSVKGRDIPGNCTPLTRSDAVDFQLKMMIELSPLKNRLFATYGPLIAALASTKSCFSVIELALRICGIGKQIKFRMGVYFSVVPSLAISALHTRYIRNDIIINKWACPVCYHLKSGLIQVFFASIFPTFIGGYYAFATARRLKIPGIPPLNSSKEIMQCLRERVGPVSNKLKMFAVAQTLLGAVLAHLEVWETNKFNLNFEKLATEYHNSTKLKSSN